MQALGIATLMYGVGVGACNFSVWHARHDSPDAMESSSLRVIVQLVLLTELTVLQIPAGIAILRRHRIARELTLALILGIIVTVGLFSLWDIVSGAADRATRLNAVFAALISFLRVLTWTWGGGGVAAPIVLVAISFGLNTRAAKDALGGHVPSTS